jgi:FkbM family methyltransferase
MSWFEQRTDRRETVGAAMTADRGSAWPTLTKRGFSFLYSRFNSRQRLKFGRLPGILPVYRAVTRRWLNRQGIEDGLVPLRLDRFVFYIDAAEFGNGWVFDSYEPATTFVFERMVTAGNVVADVGAHWGYFTLLAATLCGEAGRVIAFEPFPRNVSILTKNVHANRLTNVDIVPGAVSDREGMADLILSRDTSGNSLISVPSGAKLSPGQCDHLAVRTLALDDFFASARCTPKLIKIDIEGGELAALVGMSELIKGTRDLALIVELNPFYFPGARGEALLRRLSEEGFALALVDDARFQIETGPAAPVVQSALTKGYTINLLCARDGAIDKLLVPQGKLGAPQRPSPRIVRL